MNIPSLSDSDNEFSEVFPPSLQDNKERVRIREYRR
jgi:hypothetical protein